MASRSLTALVLALVAIPAFAGYWRPDPSQLRELRVSSESLSPAKESEDSWIEGLVTNLRRGGNRPDHVYRFAAVSAEYRINGKVQDVLTCAYRQNPQIFIILSDSSPPWAQFIVNFEQKSIYKPGWSTVYVPPSRSFCAVVLDHETNFRGIPVVGEAGNPSFDGRSVEWH